MRPVLSSVTEPTRRKIHAEVEKPGIAIVCALFALHLEAD
jgi:hypothetical protein